MKLISLRFPDKLLEEIDMLVEQGNYLNRTEALRDAARLLLRSQIGIVAGKPLEISKDEIWDELIKEIKE
jgi:Arc/MetJ-type ribon-helix-helix transcriptional regulator